MDQVSSGLALILLSLAVLLRLDGFLLIRTRMNRVAVWPAVLLNLFSPVLCIIAISYVTGRDASDRRKVQGAFMGIVEMASAFLLSQLLTGFVLAALLFVLGEDLPTGRAVGPASSPFRFLPIYLLFMIAYSSLLLLVSMKVLYPSDPPLPYLKTRKMGGAPLIALAGLPLMMVVSFGVIYVLEEAGVPGNTALFMGPRNALETGYLLLGICFIAPLAEELLFRGYMYSLIERRAGDNTAVIVTAWLFSLFHFDFLTFIPIFIMGLFMGYLRKRSGSIVPSLVFHSANNLLSMLLMLLQNDNYF